MLVRWPFNFSLKCVRTCKYFPYNDRIQIAVNEKKKKRTKKKHQAIECILFFLPVKSYTVPQNKLYALLTLFDIIK